MVKIVTSNFERLIGVWQTTGRIISGNETLKLEGIDTYEFILDGHYILHKTNVKMGTEKSETFEIITLDISGDKAQMHYFNSKGESGTMTSQISNDDFSIKGDGIKFEGTINNANTEVAGKWYLQTENKSWNEFIELKLKKQN